MREEVSKMVLYEMKDPRLGFITITKAEISPDYLLAKIFYTVLGDEKQRAITKMTLGLSRGFIQSEVSRRMRLRLVPTFSFEYDESLDTRMKMEALIKAARESDMNPPQDEPEPDDEDAEEIEEETNAEEPAAREE